MNTKKHFLAVTTRAVVHYPCSFDQSLVLLIKCDGNRGISD
ncbi:MAG: hypothetical protein ACE15D_07725 [Candidatus Eisenbacteria bacterium]